MQMKKLNFSFKINLIKKSQLNNIKLSNKKINLIHVDLNFDDEFEKQIAFEKNAQLEQYSTIYFKKINKNSIISEK